jgi:putative ATP-dependent endonuclease of OLD family
MPTGKSMNIKKVSIVNFKCFRKFDLVLNEGLNLLVGNNEAGKSTLLEAVHLALTGILNGKYLKNELSQHIFNNEVVKEYVESFQPGRTPNDPPYVLIELFFHGEDLEMLEGDGSSDRSKGSGIAYKIAFDDRHKSEYERFIRKGNIKAIPIEYYDVFWASYAREEITSRSIPIKSSLIDSSSNKYQNGSDVYINRIVRDLLDEQEVIEVSQAYRNMKDTFKDDAAIQAINTKIKTAANISRKDVKLSVELPAKNAWENSLTTYLDDIPFHYIGKGEQCIVKTKLALGHRKAKEANLILLEEPENHLSHSKLNELIKDIKTRCTGKQIIISTHSSFVANKLGLESLILLNNKTTLQLKDLREETKRFFEKLPGYDTLRLLLCKKAILVEGDSDELILQKAYTINNSGKLPIEDEIDVISVGTSFLRFLEIAEKLKIKVAVVTDSDGDIRALESKYSNYLVPNDKANISIHFDRTDDDGPLNQGGSKFNYNTLEPKIIKINGATKINTVLGKSLSENDLHIHMRANKTESALKIFETTEEFSIPQYILDAIQNS